ncbi:MAG TPA: isoprenylcysteine carboxylmethyltransferase family protein [Sporichthyaceae bacterium]|jgi:protein-S-isoprenylcysteine O-methyltransferase Ste14|nr:isoprenylcysteine carboxylmethyltransferase family protein [Sporichthyaceae bacterium]
MDDIRKRAYTLLVVRVAVTRALVLFAAAGTFAYRQAWMLLALGLIGDGATTGYLVRRDPELLHRRLTPATAETTSLQKGAQHMARVSVLATLGISGLDRRRHWSHLSPVAMFVGCLLFAAGLTIIWLAFRANTYASTVVTVEQTQVVASTGPYALVRHPMYTGMLLMVGGMAPALGSWWGLIGALGFGLTVVVRLQDEERFLTSNLLGYADYRAKVRHRLAPLVW